MKLFSKTCQVFLPVFIILLFKMVIPVIAGSQIIGKVTDAKTGKPIFFVNVYLDNTTIGTTTDEKGNFILTNLPHGNYDLVFSHIAYHVKSKDIFISPDSRLEYNIQLQPRIFKGKEVRIIAEEPKVWKKRMVEFNRMFLGETENAKMCKIINPEVLNFKEDPKTNTIIAFTDSTLLVKNNALGYLVKSEIKQFKWSKAVVEYQVHTHFEPLKPQSEKQKEFWKKNRQKAYQGSLKHFLSAFARKRLTEEGFEIYQGDPRLFKEGFGKRIKPEVLYQTSENNSNESTSYKKLYFNDWLRVVYKLSVPESENFLRLSSGTVYVDTLGNFLIAPIIEKAGDWGNTRVADALPLNYYPEF